MVAQFPARIVIALLAGTLTYVLFGSFFQYLWFTWKIDLFYLQGPYIGILSILLYGRFILTKCLRRGWHRAGVPPLREGASGGGEVRGPAATEVSIYYFFVFLILALMIFVGAAKTGIPFLGGLSFLLWAISFQFLFFPKSVWKEFSFPFFFFLLAVPLPFLNEISGLLQVWVAKLITLKFSFLGYAIVQEGITLKLPNATFQIAADCTGIKSWLVLFSLVVFFLYFLKFRLKTKIAIVFFIIPIAFVSNFIRVFILVYLGFIKGEAFAMKYWHDWGGIIFYALSCLCVLMLLGLARKYESSQ